MKDDHRTLRDEKSKTEFSIRKKGPHKNVQNKFLQDRQTQWKTGVISIIQLSKKSKTHTRPASLEPNAKLTMSGAYSFMSLENLV